MAIVVTPDALRSSREALGLDRRRFAEKFGVGGGERRVRDMEAGLRNGLAAHIPGPLAILVNLAVHYGIVREALGIEEPRLPLTTHSQVNPPPVEPVERDGSPGREHVNLTVWPLVGGSAAMIPIAAPHPSE